MDPGYVAAHIEEDPHHWWFLGRRAVLSSVLRGVLPRGALRLAEIGCGTGSLLSMSAEFGDVVGIEACPDLLEVARRSGFTVLRGSLPDDLPIEAGSLDGVLLFDVLEHISDDRAALRAVAGLLKPGGTLVLTVPAYRWLWSAHDDALGHHRRYTARSLRRLAKGAGLRPSRTTYFNTILALAVMGVRLLRRWRGIRGHDLVRPPASVNALLARIFTLEASLLRWVNFPFGVSVLLIARCRR